MAVGDFVQQIITVASGTNTSGIIWQGSNRVLTSFLVPAGMTSTTVSFKMAHRRVTDLAYLWNAIEGTDPLMYLPTEERLCKIPWTDFYDLEYFEMVFSDNEDADREITLNFREIE